MSSSVDFRAFCQAEIEEHQRLMRVYQGEESDRGVAAEHFMIAHLDDLLKKGLTPSQLALYTKEYNDLRAAMRAVAICGLKRQDYYTAATHQAQRMQAYYAAVVSAHMTVGEAYLRSLQEDDQADLQSRDEQFQQTKSEVVQRVEAGSGFTSNDPPVASDIVREALRSNPDATSRGVSKESKGN